MNRLFVLLPCYNEDGNITELTDKWLFTGEELKKSELDLLIVAVDDGSGDRTAELLKELADENKQISFIKHEVNKGLGAAINTGLKYFCGNGKDGDLLVVMDSDNTQDPKYIFDMLKKMQETGSDCVIASRYQKGSKTIGVPFFRNLLSKGAKIYYRLVLNIKGVRDYTCGYRLYKYKSIKTVYDKHGEEVLKEKSFACMMEFLYRLAETGAKFCEIPFVLRYDDKKGKSKMRVLDTVKNSFFSALKIK